MTTSTAPRVASTPPIRVVAAVVERNGTFLLAKRPPHKVLADHWEFPGGKVEIGESPQQALVRELHEELGAVGVVVGTRVGIASYDYSGFSVEIDAYRVECDANTLLPHEHTEIGWFPVAKMRTILLAPADLFLIELLSVGTSSPSDGHVSRGTPDAKL